MSVLHFPVFFVYFKNIIWHDLIHIMKFYVNSKNIFKKEWRRVFIIITITFCYFFEEKREFGGGIVGMLIEYIHNVSVGWIGESMTYKKKR